MPIQAVTHLRSLSPVSFSRRYIDEKLPKELPKDYETRTWRERVHADGDGIIVIPPMAFKKALSEAASFLGQKIPGKRNATYTKHFTAGVLVLDPLPTGVKKKDVLGEWLFVPSDGKSGGGSRVDKCFPYLPQWEGQVVWHILDQTITEDVFNETLREAGNFIGIGRFRPARGGFYGRFEVVKSEWRQT